GLTAWIGERLRAGAGGAATAAQEIEEGARAAPLAHFESGVRLPGLHEQAYDGIEDALDVTEEAGLELLTAEPRAHLFGAGDRSPVRFDRSRPVPASQPCARQSVQRPETLVRLVVAACLGDGGVEPLSRVSVAALREGDVAEATAGQRAHGGRAGRLGLAKQVAGPGDVAVSELSVRHRDAHERHE